MKKSAVRAKPNQPKSAGNRSARKRAERNRNGTNHGIHADLASPRGVIASTGSKQPASSKAK